MPFAQLVVGSPGSGKSTYCDGMQQFYSQISRPCSIVNLDPANDHTSYTPAVDVRDLVTLDEIMDKEELGPNGGVLYALEEVEQNFDWLEEELGKLGDNYVLFDCPGQVELFTHHDSLRNIFFRLQKLGYRLTAIHLTDSYVLTQPTLYISSLLLSLRSMLQLDLPHLNVLTKIDNLANYGPLPMSLEFYTEARSLEYLEPLLEEEQRRGPGATPSTTVPQDDGDEDDFDRPKSKFAALNAAILELVEDYALVGFETLCVEDRSSMLALVRAIDRASGYAFGGVEGADGNGVWSLAISEGGGRPMEVRDVEERWITRRRSFDEMERKEWEEEARREKEDAGGDSDMGGTEETKSKGGSGIKVVRKPPPTEP